MKTFILLLLSLGPFLGTSQKATPSTISNSGTVSETSDLKVSWTLGEFAIATIGNDLQLTQGMQQSKLLIETKISDTEYVNNIRIFPNPTADYLNVQIFEVQGDFSFQLLDINGNMLLSKKATESTRIDLKDLTSAAYILQILHENKIVHASQIIKL